MLVRDVARKVNDIFRRPRRQGMRTVTMQLAVSSRDDMLEGNRKRYMWLTFHSSESTQVILDRLRSSLTLKLGVHKDDDLLTQVWFNHSGWGALDYCIDRLKLMVSSMRIKAPVVYHNINVRICRVELEHLLLDTDVFHM